MSVINDNRGFLGTFNYVRRFIDSYAEITAPLVEPKEVLICCLYPPERLVRVAHLFPPLKRRGSLGHPGPEMSTSFLEFRPPPHRNHIHVFLHVAMSLFITLDFQVTLNQFVGEGSVERLK